MARDARMYSRTPGRHRRCRRAPLARVVILPLIRQDISTGWPSHARLLSDLARGSSERRAPRRQLACQFIAGEVSRSPENTCSPRYRGRCRCRACGGRRNEANQRAQAVETTVMLAARSKSHRGNGQQRDASRNRHPTEALLASHAPAGFTCRGRKRIASVHACSAPRYTVGTAI